jgi:hypothetical protein
MEMEGQCRKNARTMKKVAGRRRGGNEGKNTAVFRRRPTEKPFNEVAGLGIWLCSGVLSSLRRVKAGSVGESAGG